MFESISTYCQRVTYLAFNNQYGRIIRFFFSGGTAAFTNLIILFLLVHFLHIYYLLASVIAVTSAMVVNFTLQKFLTFEDRTEGKTRSQFVAFVAITVINIIINTGLMYLFVTVFGIWYITSQIIAAGIISFISYFSYKTIVFSQQ